MSLQSANGGNKTSQSTITFRIPEDKKEPVLEYVEAHNSSLAKLHRKTVLDKIEDEADLKTLWSVIEISKEKKGIGISQEEIENLLDEI